MLWAAGDVPGWSVGEVRNLPDAEAEALLAAHLGALIRVEQPPRRVLHGDVSRVAVLPLPPCGLWR